MAVSRDSWVVVIPGGQWQEPLVRFLQADYRVAVVNPFATETTAVADKWIGEDILHVQNYIPQLQAMSPAAILTDQCDIALDPVRSVADATGHRYHSRRTIETFRDKYAMYRHALDCGIPQLKAQLVTSAEDARRAIDQIGYPFVIKPTDANASLGVQFVTSERDEYDVGEAIRLSYRKSALVQQFAAGRHLSVDGVVAGGRHYCLSIGERHYVRPGVISRVDYTADVDESVRQAAFDYANAFIDSSGAGFGITHTEFIYSGGECYLCESAIRGGGAGTSSIVVPWVSGFDTHRALLDGHLARDVQPPQRILRRHAAILFPEFGSGRVARIIDRGVANLPGVALWKVWFQAGDTLAPATNGKTRHACLIALGNDAAEVDRVIQSAREAFQVVY